MQFPIVIAPAKPAANRFQPTSTDDCSIGIEMRQVFCVGDPLQIVGAIVALVQVFMIDLDSAIAFWRLQKCQRHQTMDGNLHPT